MIAGLLSAGIPVNAGVTEMLAPPKRELTKKVPALIGTTKATQERLAQWSQALITEGIPPDARVVDGITGGTDGLKEAQWVIPQTKEVAQITSFSQLIRLFRTRGVKLFRIRSKKGNSDAEAALFNQIISIGGIVLLAGAAEHPEVKDASFGIATGGTFEASRMLLGIFLGMIKDKWEGNFAQAVNARLEKEYPDFYANEWQQLRKIFAHERFANVISRITRIATLDDYLYSDAQIQRLAEKLFVAYPKEEFNTAALYEILHSLLVATYRGEQMTWMQLFFNSGQFISPGIPVQGHPGYLEFDLSDLGSFNEGKFELLKQAVHHWQRTMEDFTGIFQLTGIGTPIHYAFNEQLKFLKKIAELYEKQTGKDLFEELGWRGGIGDITSPDNALPITFVTMIQNYDFFIPKPLQDNLFIHKMLRKIAGDWAAEGDALTYFDYEAKIKKTIAEAKKDKQEKPKGGYAYPYPVNGVRLSKAEQAQWDSLVENFDKEWEICLKACSYVPTWALSQGTTAHNRSLVEFIGAMGSHKETPAATAVFGDLNRDNTSGISRLETTFGSASANFLVLTSAAGKIDTHNEAYRAWEIVPEEFIFDDVEGRELSGLAAAPSHAGKTLEGIFNLILEEYLKLTLGCDKVTDQERFEALTRDPALSKVAGIAQNHLKRLGVSIQTNTTTEPIQPSVVTDLSL